MIVDSVVVVVLGWKAGRPPDFLWGSSTWTYTEYFIQCRITDDTMYEHSIQQLMLPFLIITHHNVLIISGKMLNQQCQ